MSIWQSKERAKKMKYLIISLLALLPFGVFAQEQEQDVTKFFGVTQVCAPFDIAFGTATDKGETLLFRGTAGQLATMDGKLYSSGMFFFVNQQTGNWSMIGVYGDGSACLIANGVGFEPYSE